MLGLKTTSQLLLMMVLKLVGTSALSQLYGEFGSGETDESSTTRLFL